MSINTQVVKAKRGYSNIVWILREVKKHGGIIAGSYPAWCAADAAFLPPKPNDLDIFPKDEQAFNRLSDWLYEDGQLEVETDTALTFQTPALPVQLVKPRNWQSPEKVISDFDFPVCQAAFLSQQKILVGEHFFTDMESKRLRLLRVNDPVMAIVRIGKYIGKGYKIDPMQVRKIFAAWDGMSDEAKTLLDAQIEAAFTPDVDEDYGTNEYGYYVGERFISWDSYDDDDYNDGDYDNWY